MMDKINPIRRLGNLVVEEKKEITSIYFYAILSGLVQLSVPIGVQAIIGFVQGAAMVTSIYVLIILVVLGVFFVGVFQMNQMKIIEKIQQNIFTRFAFDFAEKIPRFDLKKTDNLYLPEHVNKFFDILNVQKGLSKLLLDIPIATIQVLFGLILLALYHPVFIVFGLLLLSILLTILKFTSRKGLETSLKESSYKYAVVAWLQEMARVIKSFKFSQGTHLNLQKTDQNMMGYLIARTMHFKVLLLQYKTLVFFKVAITMAMLTIGAYLLVNQQLNIGEFIAAEIVILMVIAAIEKLIGSLDSVYDVITGLEKLALVAESPLEKDGKMKLNPKNQGIEIELIDFSFEYQEGKKIFDGLSLTIPANARVCISGKEGAGKSTLLKILGGSYGDFGGSILLNGIPIHNYELATLRSKTGIYLTQYDIFKGTVLENISMGRPETTPEKISSIARKIGIENIFISLKNGFETPIDAAGKKLSSNIAKKILLLRALANQPHLLLLDEPWMGMEQSTANSLMDYLLDRTMMQTIIVASNDQEFAKKCDYQIELADGVVTVTKNDTHGEAAL